jgi:hypothetical protein
MRSTVYPERGFDKSPFLQIFSLSFLPSPSLNQLSNAGPFQACSGHLYEQDYCTNRPSSSALICNATSLEYVRHSARLPPMYQKPGCPLKRHICFKSCTGQHSSHTLYDKHGIREERVAFGLTAFTSPSGSKSHTSAQRSATVSPMTLRAVVRILS